MLYTNCSSNGLGNDNVQSKLTKYTWSLFRMEIFKALISTQCYFTMVTKKGGFHSSVWLCLPACSDAVATSPLSPIDAQQFVMSNTIHRGCVLGRESSGWLFIIFYPFLSKADSVVIQLTCLFSWRQVGFGLLFFGFFFLKINLTSKVHVNKVNRCQHKWHLSSLYRLTRDMYINHNAHSAKSHIRPSLGGLILQVCMPTQ